MLYRLADVVMIRKVMQQRGLETSHQWAKQHKLDAMVGYCETVHCRRQVLLGYFGEDLDAACGNCDTCLEPVETWDGTVAAQKLMSCIARTGQRFGSSHVVDVLLGRDTKKIRRHGHDRLSTYGIGTEHPKKTWRSVVRQLVAAGYLSVDVSGYGSLRLTPACEPVLNGAEPIHLRTDPEPEAQAAASKQTVREGGLQTPEDRALFERLREVRLTLAREQGVPPYVIFHDSTLAAMAQHRPADLDAFGRLSGVGAVKTDRYGTLFLDAIRDHLHEAA
jgi:ATP-dependent DNA helicase RecQ